MKNTILWIGALVVGTINMNGCAAFILVTSRHLCRRQCRRSDGLLLPYALADDRHRSTRRRDGHHPAHLHHHRHGGDRRERVVRLLRLRYDRSRYKMRKYAILIIAVR